MAMISPAQARSWSWIGWKRVENKYELRKGPRLGPGNDDAKEITVLNRVIRWTETGLEYEADPRQAERLLEGIGLDDGCKVAATPGLKPLVEQLKEDVPLPASSFTDFGARPRDRTTLPQTA